MQIRYSLRAAIAPMRSAMALPWFCARWITRKRSCSAASRSNKAAVPSVEPSFTAITSMFGYSWPRAASMVSSAALFDRLAAEHDRLRVIHLAQNQGKAMALRMGAMAARSEYLICIDGDALLAPDASSYLVAPLVENPRVAAVTGNPRIRTRSTLIGRIQVGEFSSIIGLIKRTQRVYGRMFTVSGVCSSFRRKALVEVDYWAQTGRA